MEGPGGLLHDPDVEKLLSQFILIEIFTDRLPEEREYADLQKELTGYNANPTYIVFDSVSHLEVAREAYTNSKRQFLEFLEQGLTDTPAFQSQVRFSGLEIVEGGEVEGLVMGKRHGTGGAVCRVSGHWSAASRKTAISRKTYVFRYGRRWRGLRVAWDPVHLPIGAR